MRNSLSGVLLVGLLALGCDVETEAPTAGSPATSAASKLTLQAESRTFLPYQRVLVMASFTGASAPALGPEAGEVAVRISGPGKRDYVVRPVAQRCRGLEIAAEHDAELIDLSSDAGGWLFTEPGEYQIELELVGSARRSNRLALTVLAPSSSADLEAVAAIRQSPTFADFLHFDGGDRQSRDLALATRLANGRSSYRDDMRDLLVRHYSRQSVTTAGEIRPPDRERALAYYDAVDAAPERGFAKMSTLWYLNRLQSLGQGARSVDVAAELARIETRFPALQAGRLQTRPLRRDELGSPQH
jgi:hypothetical protein